MKPGFRCYLAVLLLTWGGLSPATWSLQASQKAPTIFEALFEEPELPSSWRSEGSGIAGLDHDPSGSRVLHVVTPTPDNHLVKIPLPLDKMRGFQVTLSGRVKAAGISKPPVEWQGLKFMIFTLSPKGPDYQSMMKLHGTFDWKELGLNVVIPPDATEAALILGLEQSSGQAWFDDVKITLASTPRKRPENRPALLPPEKLDRRSDLPRLRGVMYGPKGKEEDIRKLAEWKGNLIRWQFYWYDGTFPEKRLDLALYDRWLEETMAEVDRFLPLCEELGIRVVIDLHTPPGGIDAGQTAIFQQAILQKKFIEVWDKLATHYKDKPSIWGYDLVNEPVEGKVAEGLLDWRSLAEFVSKRVRAIDPARAIIIEPGPHGGWGNLPFFEPIPVPGIVYSIHMYEPIFFTHQGVLDGMPAGVSYPGEVRGEKWDKERLRRAFTEVLDYQKDYNVPIFVGEFSAPRWAPDGSAARYLKDCIDLYEEFGWDWAYHAFREWHGWNVELIADKDNPVLSPSPTNRETLLREGFRKNR